MLTTFSFIAISMSSAGARLNLAGTETGTDSHARFVFSVFSLLAASAFLCAVLATLLSQLVKRQLALTQTKEDHTAHEFAARFGFYIRLGGGLTSFAAMFLATAIFHFLLSIYQVPVSVAVALAACWIVGGTLAVESFMSKFGLWTLGEVRCSRARRAVAAAGATAVLTDARGRVSCLYILCAFLTFSCLSVFLSFPRRSSTMSAR